MNLLTTITLIFIVLKLTGYIDWSWWFVLLPTIAYAIIWTALTVWWESKTPIEKARWKLGIK